MSSNLGSNAPSTTSSPNLAGLPRVDLVKNDFDGIVYQKGYTVTIEKALKCPCRNVQEAAPLPSCRNCAGSGWMFYNKLVTKMVLQSMNMDTKFKTWSEEKMGVVKISAMSELELGYMDKVTIVDAEVVDSQVLFAKDYNEGYSDKKLRAKTIYDINSILDVFFFEGSDKPLMLLTEGVDFTINTQQRNIIELDPKFNKYEHPTISIRYRHNPTFYILEFMRELMSTQKVDKTTGSDQTIVLPVHAMGRRAHYVLNEENSSGTYLFDNSYSSKCAIMKGYPLKPTAPFVSSRVAGSVTIGWTDPSSAETNFIVQRRVGESGTFAQVDVLPANTTTYTDTNVSTGSKYYYRIALMEGGKQSPWSDLIGVSAV